MHFCLQLFAVVKHFHRQILFVTADGEVEIHILCLAQLGQHIKELYQRIQVLVYDVYSSKCLLNCIKGNNSRALYRDSGLLIGWRLQSMQSANTKALKAYGRVVEALKK